MVEGSALKKTFTLSTPSKVQRVLWKRRQVSKNQKLLLNGCEMPPSKLNTTSAINNSQQLRLPALSCHKNGPISHVQGKDLWEPTLTAELLATDRFCSWEMESLVFRCAPTAEFIKLQQTALHR